MHALLFARLLVEKLLLDAKVCRFRLSVFGDVAGHTAKAVDHAPFVANLDCLIVDPADARVRILELTEIGRRLMFDSLDVMADLERRYAKLIGSKTLRAALDGLEKPETVAANA